MPPDPPANPPNALVLIRGGAFAGMSGPEELTTRIRVIDVDGLPDGRCPNCAGSTTLQLVCPACAIDWNNWTLADGLP